MKASVLKDLREATAGVPRPGGPARFVRMVKPRFVGLVKRRKKRQTIRPLPKRIPRRGDILDLRQWIGKPYRSKQRKIIETKLTEIKVCRIAVEGVHMQSRYGFITFSGGDDADRFARDDGFKDFAELVRWFQAEHGLPFDGVILFW